MDWSYKSQWDLRGYFSPHPTLGTLTPQWHLDALQDAAGRRACELSISTSLNAKMLSLRWRLPRRKPADAPMGRRWRKTAISIWAMGRDTQVFRERARMVAKESKHWRLKLPKG
jgi:hypothetical protein